MAKGHRSQIKRERNAQKDTQTMLQQLSYARCSVTEGMFRIRCHQRQRRGDSIWVL